MIPYDPKTGNIIEDFDINDQTRDVEWRDMNGNIVDIAKDVNFTYGDFVSDVKKMAKATLKFVRKGDGGILTAGDDTFQCTLQGKSPVRATPAPMPVTPEPVPVTPEPERVIHHLVTRKKHPVALFPLPN
jgi:hypothetical protein